jgi:DNA-binding Lrp family transcriptional regulator
MRDQPKRQEVLLDDVDHKLIWELCKDARISNRALADAVGMAQSTCLTRVQRLKETGVLRSAHFDVDLDLIGLPVQAIIGVRIRPQSRIGIREYGHRVIMLANVAGVYFIGGDEDFLIHVMCASTAQLRDFVADELSMDPAVASTRTSIVFEFLAGNQHLDRVQGLAQVKGNY